MLIRFKEYLSEASKAGKNTHMTHIEDRVLYGNGVGYQAVVLKQLHHSR